MSGRAALADVRAGSRARISAVTAEPATVRRLAELGLTPGSLVTVVQSSGGPLVIATRGSRIAIGRRLARQVAVEPVDPPVAVGESTEP